MCRKNQRTHKHHIIPRYMGGTNAVENLIEVTVTQHAMYHFCNYQLWGNEEDKIAWKTLSGQITLDRAKQEAMMLGAKKGAEKIKQKYINDIEYQKSTYNRLTSFLKDSVYLENSIKRCKQNQRKAVEASKTPESRKKQKEKLSEIEHNKGKKNPQYGKMWITNGTKEGTYRIKKEEQIPDGYWKGRVCFDIKPKGENTSNYGKIWINNGIENRMIPKDCSIPEGYTKGMISR